MDTSEALVLETLTRACSQNSAVLKPAEQQLEEWQAKPGFYTVLCTIFSNHSLDVNVRWLAVLYFKNGVDRYRRKSAPNAIDEGEKEDLRKRLISNFNEPVPQVATQLAVLISKIARLDCPREWPALVPTLLTGVRCQQDLLQQRALLVLHHVTKTLASKRLTSDRKLFEDLTLDVFGYVLDLWNKHLSEFLQLASQHDETMIQPLDRTILTLRVLRKQAVFGFREPQKNPLINSFMAMVFEKVKPTLECRRSLWGNHQMIERVEKLALLMTKVLLDMLEHHPSTYVVYIRPTLDFVVTYTFTNVGQGILFERFTVNCFNLMKGIVHCDSYRPPKNTEEARDPVTVAAYRVITEFFTQGVLAEICGHLVSSYFLLTTDDLITWESDPEDYALDEGGDSYKFSLRPCTEVLFLSLFKEFRKTLIPVLLEIVNGLQGPCDPDNMADMLRKEAVYNAVGLASFDLYDDVDFDNWFSTHLLQELSIKHPNQRIIRRRVIWLAGQWVGVKFGVSLRPALYEAILPLLHTTEDLVVRIEAATTLKTAVDDFEFKTEQFLPYLDTAFGLLFQLLKDVDECDSKMHILHVISFVIERVGVQIRPHASCLVQYLPILWQDAAEHNMLRCAILTTLIHLVQGLGTTCTDMFHFLLPVIQMSTDMSQDPHIYLKEDGLELWHVTLHNTPVITDQLLNLVRNMPSLLELGSENLRISLRIIEAYLLLAPKELMQNYGSVLVTGLCGLMTEVRTEGLVLILRIVELVLRTFPVEGPQVFRPILPSVIRGILEKEEHGSVIAMYFSLLARIILQNTEFLWTYLNQTAPEFGNDSLELFGCLLDVWFEKMDSITQPERRKLSALALSSMLTLNIGVVLERFSGVLCLCVEVLHDVLRSDSDSTQNTDCLVLSNAEEFLSEEETDTEHDKRKRQLSLQDPVHTVDLREYVRTQLSGCCQLLGQAHFSQLMDAADTEIVHQLQELMKS